MFGFIVKSNVGSQRTWERRNTSSLEKYLITGPAPVIMRPFACIYNPFPYRCSVLCNHPADVDIRNGLGRPSDKVCLTIYPNLWWTMRLFFVTTCSWKIWGACDRSTLRIEWAPSTSGARSWTCQRCATIGCRRSSSGNTRKPTQSERKKNNLKNSQNLFSQASVTCSNPGECGNFEVFLK